MLYYENIITIATGEENHCDGGDGDGEDGDDEEEDDAGEDADGDALFLSFRGSLQSLQLRPKLQLSIWLHDHNGQDDEDNDDDDDFDDYDGPDSSKCVRTFHYVSFQYVSR